MFHEWDFEISGRTLSYPSKCWDTLLRAVVKSSKLMKLPSPSGLRKQYEPLEPNTLPSMNQRPPKYTLSHIRLCTHTPFLEMQVYILQGNHSHTVIEMPFSRPSNTLYSTLYKLKK